MKTIMKGPFHCAPKACMQYDCKAPQPLPHTSQDSEENLTGPVHAQDYRIVIQEGEGQADDQGKQEGYRYAACNSKGQAVNAKHVAYNPVQYQPVNQENGEAVPAYGGEQGGNPCKQTVPMFSEEEKYGAGKEHLGRRVVVNQGAQALRGHDGACYCQP